MEDQSTSVNKQISRYGAEKITKERGSLTLFTLIELVRKRILFKAHEVSVLLNKTQLHKLVYLVKYFPFSIFLVSRSIINIVGCTP